MIGLTDFMGLHALRQAVARAQMPTIRVWYEDDIERNMGRFRLLPDLRAPLSPRYCPESNAIRQRDLRRAARRLDAVEHRSTLSTNQGV
ncbi:hypothetical protein [Pararhodobacter sp.]|uniref:hypothetical protein n=1 Tax=Pararhodobacter sp. TaxID=2127056 RepID=UPI002FDEE9F5